LRKAVILASAGIVAAISGAASETDKRFADDREFPLHRGAEHFVGEIVVERPTGDEALDLLGRFQRIREKFIRVGAFHLTLE
jgi:hypothetical protein